MYLLREDMFHEWAWENGATEIICLSNNVETIYNNLYKRIKDYESRGYIIEPKIDNVGLLKQIKDIIMQKVVKGIEDCGVYIDIYTSQEDFENGKNMATLTVTHHKVEK